MKTKYQIKVNECEDGKICQRFLVRILLLPPSPFEEDTRPCIRLEITNNIDDALYGSKEVMKHICKFINKVAPHFGARVV